MDGKEPASISPRDLYAAIGTANAPLVIDVRRSAGFDADDRMLVGALVVRGADTARLELTPQSPGLLALSLALAANFADDHAMLEHGIVMYDAFYAWCRLLPGEGHDWNPAAMGATR